MTQRSQSERQPIVVAALYHFARLPDYADKQAPLTALCQAQGVMGTLLLADEGVNGTVAGPRAGIDAVLAWLRSDTRLADMAHKESLTDEMPFHRLKVRLKKEIVTMGVPGTDPNRIKGTYLNAREWNDVINDPDVLVIDTRNEYEIAVGSFPNAVSPRTSSFREFPDFVKTELAGREQQKIAMFCTGGIRCEKSTSYLKSLGYESVYHLEGGILKYLETVPPSENQWQGDCFVFDGRVAVNRDLEPSGLRQCHACRRPLTAEELESPDYEKGVSCPHCITELDDTRRASFRERQRQVDLAAARGEKHIGQALPRAAHSSPQTSGTSVGDDAGD